MTPEEVIPLLAHSIEMNSSAELENYKILCEAGERAFPAMAKILLDGKEPDVIRSIIPFFVDTKGDKTIPLQAMSKYVEMHARNPSVNQEICSLFIAFGDIGGANEVTFLKQYLDVKDPIIRASIEGNIERIEKRLNPEKPRIPHP